MFKVYEVVVRDEWLPLVPVGAVTVNIDKFHWEANVALTFEEWQLDYTEWLILTKSFLSHLVTIIVAGLFCMTRENIQTNIKLIEYGNQHLFGLF